ncbi:glucose-1-phosphate adenylyltransferase [Achromatium sp. WMS1]|nr:glucose-1-phosphate adenylyltransferase [Achromatium sp. WMS1]
MHIEQHPHRNTLAIILAGGRGSRLQHLTRWRAKPAVPFGGKFRIIDFPLSNCVNSGIRRIGVLTQYKAHSLILHIQKGWGFLRGELSEFVELWPAQQRIASTWYTGTADAVYQNLDIIRNHDPEYVLILAGDHVYKMDYEAMISFHVRTKADMTVGCIEADLMAAKSLGVMEIDNDHRIQNFQEKPSFPKPLPGRSDVALTSMGIYLFNTKFLIEQLTKDSMTSESSHDFGKDIIPSIIKSYRIMAHPFINRQGTQAYWRDVGTIDAFWEANLELTKVTPPLNLYDRNWPIWTYQEQLPPAKFVFNDNNRRGTAVDSMVSGGCIISGSKISNSLLFSNVRINSFSNVTYSVILPDVNVSRHCRISKAIIDQGVTIPEGTIIGEDPEQDAQRFYISPNGIVLVTGDMFNQSINYVR